MFASYLSPLRTMNGDLLVGSSVGFLVDMLTDEAENFVFWAIEIPEPLGGSCVLPTRKADFSRECPNQNSDVKTGTANRHSAEPPR